MKKIFLRNWQFGLLILIISVCTAFYADFEPILWKLSGTNLVPTNSNWKVSTTALPVGTSANNLVQLDGTAKLPGVDGSQLTNLPSSGGGILFAKRLSVNDTTQSGTYVDVPAMQVSLLANTNYYVTGQIQFSMSGGDAAGDTADIRFLIPSGAIFKGLKSTAAANVADAYLNTSPLSSKQPSGSYEVRFSGILTTNSTADLIKLQLRVGNFIQGKAICNMGSWFVVMK